MAVDIRGILWIFGNGPMLPALAASWACLRGGGDGFRSLQGAFTALEDAKIRKNKRLKKLRFSDLFSGIR